MSAAVIPASGVAAGAGVTTGPGVAAGAGVTPASGVTTDRERAIAAVRELLLATGEDVERPGLLRTPERVADLFLEMFSGVGEDPAIALGAPVALTENEHPGELIGVTGIPFRSSCEHHLLPFEGVVDVFYAPTRHIAGLSRIASLVDAVARRPQLQERLGQQIAETLMSSLEPHGVVVRIDASHGCVAHREPRAATARALTVAVLGEIPDAAWRFAAQP